MRIFMTGVVSFGRIFTLDSVSLTDIGQFILSIYSCVFFFTSCVLKEIFFHFIDTADPWTTWFQLCRSIYYMIIFNKYVLQDLVETVNVDPWMQNYRYRVLTVELYTDFQLGREDLFVPLIHVVQWSTIFFKWLANYLLFKCYWYLKNLI